MRSNQLILWIQKLRPTDIKVLVRDTGQKVLTFTSCLRVRQARC